MGTLAPLPQAQPCPDPRLLSGRLSSDLRQSPCHCLCPWDWLGSPAQEAGRPPHLALGTGLPGRPGWPRGLFTFHLNPSQYLTDLLEHIPALRGFWETPLSSPCALTFLPMPPSHMCPDSRPYFLDLARGLHRVTLRSDPEAWGLWGGSVWMTHWDPQRQGYNEGCSRNRPRGGLHAAGMSTNMTSRRPPCLSPRAGFLRQWG